MGKPTRRNANAEIEALIQERDHWRRIAEEGLEPHIARMRYEDGNFSAAVAGAAAEAVAVALVSTFKEMGADNYLEMNLFDRAEPAQRYTVTVQRVGALSPADKVRIAEERASALEAELSAIRESR